MCPAYARLAPTERRPGIAALARTTSCSLCLRSSIGSQLWTGYSRFEEVGWPGPPALDAMQVREIAVRYAWAASIARGPVASRIALLVAEAH
jgi:hypothetical protein